MSNTPKLYPLLDFTRIAITGADRQNFINNFCTNNVRKLEPGQGCEAFITNVKGHTISHGWFWALENELLYDTMPGQGAALVAHWDRYIIREKVELEDRTDKTGWMCLAGAGVEKLLSVYGTLPDQPMRCTKVLLDGAKVLVAKIDWFNEPSFLLSYEDWFAPLRLDQWIKKGSAEMQNFDQWEAKRIAAKLPLFGQDITDENLPQELARDKQAISFTKGCYLGQETIARLDALGQVTKLFVGLRPVDPLAREFVLPLELIAEGKTVGKVTSFTKIVPDVANKPQALGFVRRVLAKPGTIVESSAGKFEVV